MIDRIKEQKDPNFYINDIKERFGDKILDTAHPRHSRIYILVDKKDAPEVVKYIFYEYAGRHSISSGVDTPDGVEILYHMALDNQRNIFINVKTLVPREDFRIESIGKDIPAFDWIEREIHELFGVEFVGHPDMRHLLLADDWPEGKYPMRKDFRRDF